MYLYTIANLLSLFRLIAAPIFIIIIIYTNSLATQKIHILIFLLIIQLTDVLDGWMARFAKRITNKENEIGKLLDPVADKVFIDASYIMLTLLFHFPIWVTIIVVIRDLLLINGWLFRKIIFKISTIIPNVLGKITDSVQAFLVFGYLLELPTIVINIWILIMIILTILSGYIYLKDGYRLIINEKY